MIVETTLIKCYEPLNDVNKILYAFDDLILKISKWKLKLIKLTFLTETVVTTSEQLESGESGPEETAAFTEKSFDYITQVIHFNIR